MAQSRSFVSIGFSLWTGLPPSLRSTILSGIGADSLGALGANAPREKDQWVPGTQKHSDLKFKFVFTICYRNLTTCEAVQNKYPTLHDITTVSFKYFSNHVALDFFPKMH